MDAPEIVAAPDTDPAPWLAHLVGARPTHDQISPQAAHPVAVPAQQPCSPHIHMAYAVAPVW